jgi:lysophospholipase L1-like esterase
MVRSIAISLLATSLAGCFFGTTIVKGQPTGLDASTTIKIMPLGDSITFGVPSYSYGSYRRLLGKLLENDGYHIDYVGSLRSGDDIVPGPSHEGHPAWTISEVINGIDSERWLETPDIILLHIGTNDIGRGRSSLAVTITYNAASAANKLAALLDDMLARLPHAHIIVAQIIPFKGGSSQGHRLFNAAIPGIVAARGPQVSMVDMQGLLLPTDYADSIHPNPAGYDKMARAWKSAIRAVVAPVRGTKSESDGVVRWAYRKPIGRLRPLIQVDIPIDCNQPFRSIAVRTPRTITES